MKIMLRKNRFIVNDRISFGNWVRRRRKALDLTQKDLADRIGCSKVTIVKIEADERRQSRQLSELLARSLEISANERDLFIQVSRQEKNVESLIEPFELPARLDMASLISRLPVAPTPLVGRQREVAEINRLSGSVRRCTNCRVVDKFFASKIVSVTISAPDQSGSQVTSSF